MFKSIEHICLSVENVYKILAVKMPLNSCKNTFEMFLHEKEHGY